ncbi:MAG: hypothetical protein ACFFDP_09015, partial [Promethearchaeota archaeon]
MNIKKNTQRILLLAAIILMLGTTIQTANATLYSLDDGASGGFVKDQSPPIPTPPPWDFVDEFSGVILNTTKWNPVKVGSHIIDYNVGTDYQSSGWGGNWLYTDVMGGGTPDYIGWEFNHEITQDEEGPWGYFVINCELGWWAASNTPIFHVQLRLLDEDEQVCIVVGYKDSWAYGSTRQEMAIIGDRSNTVGGLPMEGKASIEITRDADNLVNIKWDTNLLLSGVCSAPVATIQLRVIGHKTYTGGQGGFNYIHARGDAASGADYYDVADEFDPIGQAPPSSLDDSIDQSIWTVSKDGTPSGWSYSFDEWSSGWLKGSWLRCHNMAGGGSTYNGYKFTHELDVFSKYYQSFTVDTEIYW